MGWSEGRGCEGSVGMGGNGRRWDGRGVLWSPKNP